MNPLGERGPGDRDIGRVAVAVANGLADPQIALAEAHVPDGVVRPVAGQAVPFLPEAQRLV